MVVKPLLRALTRANNTTLAMIVKVIIDAMTNNPNFPSQSSGIAEVTTLHDALVAAISAAEDGGRMALNTLRVAREALLARMKVLALYVQMHSNNDMGILLSSGFEPQKTSRQPAVIPTAPELQTLDVGPTTGTAVFKVVSQGARAYLWRYALASAPTDYLNAPQTSAANTSFSGLTPVTKYLFQCCAMNAAGTGDWSLPFPLVVL